MHELLNMSFSALTELEKDNENKLFILLEALDYRTARKLLAMHNDMDLKKLLDSELYYCSERDFEKDLYEVLVSGRDSEAWLKLSKDTDLSDKARARSAYLYSFLTKMPVESLFRENINAGLYHGNKNKSGNGLARLYGLNNGIDMQRFNQFKMTGGF